MSSPKPVLPPYVAPLPDLFGQAVATGTAKQRRTPRVKKTIRRDVATPLLDALDANTSETKPAKKPRMPKGVINQAVYGATHVGAAPRVSDIEFKHFVCDADNRVLYDEGNLFFNNGWGACVRRHYEHHGRKRTMVYYSVAVKVLFRGGHSEFAYKWQFPENAPIVEDNFRQIFPKEKVENPHSFTDRDRYVLAINAFLRRVQYLWRHSKAPEPANVKTPSEQFNIKSGLPQKLKPAQRQKTLDITPPAP